VPASPIRGTGWVSPRWVWQRPDLSSEAQYLVATRTFAGPGIGSRFDWADQNDGIVRSWANIAGIGGRPTERPSLPQAGYPGR
jgi:hypothetical protein